MKAFETMRTYGIRAQKKLGQNFLVDQNVCEKICHSAGITAADHVIEIGAGFGLLTDHILQAGCHVVAIERDPKLCDVLRKEMGHIPLLDIIHSSILDIDLKHYAHEMPLTVIGNLPYYLTSKILFYLVEYREYIRTAYITIQKEVADRLLAMPGCKDYGRLTVMMRLYAGVERLFDIKPASFYPAPEVSSTVLKITFHPHPLPSMNERLFQDVVQSLFQERRKMVLNGLQLLKTKKLNRQGALAMLEKAQVDSTKRPEHLMIKDFIAITQAVEQYDDLCEES